MDDNGSGRVTSSWQAYSRDFSEQSVAGYEEFHDKYCSVTHYSENYKGLYTQMCVKDICCL